ncbi:TPA: hypothetical protein DF272_03735 [Candidatus Falkowbacteria bacterium]|nr:hypothetical protein [Candidatus Falkowbacteria bacterium]
MRFNDFTLTAPDNSNFNLYEYGQNNPVLLIFFRGAWCGYCKKQLIELAKNIDFFNQKNIKIVAISNDSQLKSSLLKTFLKLPFPILSDPDTKLITDLGLTTVYKTHKTSKPAVYLISSEHDVLFSYVGEEYDDRLSIDMLKQKIHESL